MGHDLNSCHLISRNLTGQSIANIRPAPRSHSRFHFPDHVAIQGHVSLHGDDRLLGHLFFSPEDHIRHVVVVQIVGVERLTNLAGQILKKRPSEIGLGGVG